MVYTVERRRAVSGLAAIQARQMNGPDLAAQIGSDQIRGGH